MIGSSFPTAEMRIAQRGLAQYDQIRAEGGDPSTYDAYALEDLHQIQLQGENEVAIGIARSVEGIYDKMQPMGTGAVKPLADIMRSTFTVLAAAVPPQATIAMGLARIGATAMTQRDIPIGGAGWADIIGLGFTHAVKDTTQNPQVAAIADKTLNDYNNIRASGQPGADVTAATELQNFLIGAVQHNP